jgi:hypothetical protein
MYFSACHTADECRSRYRELAKQLHPDKGGNASDFQRMQEEYEKRLAELIKGTRTNSIEYNRLVTALLEILKITKPEYYQFVKVFGNHPTAGMISELVSMLFPKQKNTVSEILKLLQ